MTTTRYGGKRQRKHGKSKRTQRRRNMQGGGGPPLNNVSNDVDELLNKLSGSTNWKNDELLLNALVRLKIIDASKQNFIKTADTSIQYDIKEIQSIENIVIKPSETTSNNYKSENSKTTSFGFSNTMNSSGSKLLTEIFTVMEKYVNLDDDERAKINTYKGMNKGRVSGFNIDQTVKDNFNTLKLILFAVKQFIKVFLNDYGIVTRYYNNEGKSSISTAFADIKAALSNAGIIPESLKESSIHLSKDYVNSIIKTAFSVILRKLNIFTDTDITNVISAADAAAAGSTLTSAATSVKVPNLPTIVSAASPLDETKSIVVYVGLQNKTGGTGVEVSPTEIYYETIDKVDPTTTTITTSVMTKYT